MKTTATQTAEQKINALKGLYTFKSPYHEDERKLPFEVIGNSYNKEFPVQVKTVEFRGYNKKEITTGYTVESIEQKIESGFLTKVEAPDLNMLFIDQIRNFAFLLTSIDPLTKEEFLLLITSVCSLGETKTALFYQATQKSKFNTIRLSDDRSQVLFNQ